MVLILVVPPTFLGFEIQIGPFIPFVSPVLPGWRLDCIRSNGPIGVVGSMCGHGESDLGWIYDGSRAVGAGCFIEIA
jgi:hypothetical protein